MVQDITPNTGSAVTNTNTMSPKTLSPQSAGSTTPTIISQSNADRRRRANAEKEARKRQNLAANVQRAEVEKEYRRLREAEQQANERAKVRKENAEKRILKFETHGYFVPSEGKYYKPETKEISVYDYLKGNLQGESDPVTTPNELTQYISIDRSGGVDTSPNVAYEGLQKLTGSVTKMLDTEIDENKRIAGAIQAEAISRGSTSNTPIYTPMSEEARAAHLSLIENPNTDAETRQHLMDDIKIDDSHRGYVTEGDQTKLMNIALSSTAPKDAKQFAFNYLGEIGSTVGKADFNKSADAIYVSQYNKNNQAFLDRSRGSVYDIQPDTSSTRAIEENRTVKTELQAKDKSSDLDAKTRAAIAANQSGGTEALDTLRKARLNALEAGDVGVTGYVVEDENDPNFGKFRPDKNGNLVQYSVDPEEERQREANERLFARQNAEVQAQLNNNPNYVESILKVGDGNKLDLSSDAFFREQAATEREYGNTDWTSAGGKSANRAMMEGEDSTSYSRFKAAPDTATNEYILISNDGKQRYTLRTSDRGGRFAIYGWAGDIVASGDTAEGLPSALKKLNVPFNEETFNPYVPDADDTRVMLDDESDLGDMEETPAMFKSKQLGTYRTNDEIREAEFDRRDALASSINGGFNDYFDGIKELGDSIDESLAKYDEEYHKTLDELSPPADKSAMARQQRFEGYTDKDQEGFLSTVNRMRAEAGMGESGIGESADIGGFGGADTGNLFSRNAGAARADFSDADSYGGYAGGNIDDEDFDESDYDDGEFADADGEGEDFAEEIPEEDDFGEKPAESFGGKNLFGGAFGKTPKDFGANTEFTSKTDIDESSEPFADIESTPEPSVKPTFTETGSPFMSAAQTSRDMFALKDKDLSSVPKYTERDHTPKERTKTIFDQMDLDKELGDIYSRIGLLSEGGTDDSGRAVAGLYPSTKKYAETVDELVGSGALIADGNKRETLYSDAENPDKNIDAYTNLRWSSRATPDIMDRFKQVETDMNKASEDLNAEYKKLTEKHKEKEQLDKDIYGGIPHGAKEIVHTVLPDPKSIKPALNTLDYINPATLPIRRSQDKLGDAWGQLWGEAPKNEFNPEYWREKLYDSPPLFYNLFDYDEFYKDPASYGAQYVASYALTGGLGAAARAGAKAVPKVSHTVIDPLKNSALIHKSQKYIEGLTEKLPRSPVGMQYTIIDLPGGTAKSVSLVRRVKNLDIAHPLVTTLDNRLNNTKELYFGDPKFKNPWVLIQDSNTGNIAEAFIPKSGVDTAYVKGATKALLKKADDSDYLIKTYGFKDKEAYKKSLQNALDRFSIITDLNKHIQNASPVAIQSLEPHVQKVIAAKNIFKYPKKISKAIVETMNDFKVHSQSSLTQFSQGWEFGGGGLSRNPNDFDLFVDNPKEFVETLAKRINDIEGREIVYVKGNKILFKDTGDEFFDAHFMGQFGSDSLFSGMGVRTELPVKIGKSNVTTTTMSQQNINKETALFNFTEPKSYPKFPEAFGEGKPGVGWVQPRKEDRAKDLKDFAFGTLDQINQMLSSKIARERKEGLKALKAFNKFLKTYGDEAYDEIMKDYTQFKKLHGSKTKPFKGEVIRVDKFGINSSPEQGEKAINATVKKYKKDPQVVNILEKIRENLNANTVIGVPLGLFITATYIQSVATRIANRETTPQEVMSKEIAPMLVGAKLSGKSMIKFDEWNAFRKRDRYIPPTVISDIDIVTGAKKFPGWHYNDNNPENTKEFVDLFRKGGEALKRIENQGFEIPDNVKMGAIRVQSQSSDQIRPNVINVRPTMYKENPIFSFSFASRGSFHFDRTDRPPLEEKGFSFNIIPKTYDPPRVYNVLSTQEIGQVPFGLGEAKTEEYILKHLKPDQAAAISAKTAKQKQIYAEIEGTMRPYTELEILDATGYTMRNNKRIAVDTLAVIPTGSMKTDVKIKVKNMHYNPKTEKFPDRLSDIFAGYNDFKETVDKNPMAIMGLFRLEEPYALKYRIQNAKNYYVKNPENPLKISKSQREGLEKLLDNMYNFIDKNEKEYHIRYNRLLPISYKMTRRTDSGNPLIASPLYSTKKEDKSKETSKNPFDFDYKMPDFFSPSSPSSVKSTSKSITSTPTTKKSPPSVPSRPPTTKSPPSVPSTPSVPSRPPTTKYPPSVPSTPSVPSRPPTTKSPPSVPSTPSVPSRPPTTKSPPSVPSIPSVPSRPPTTKSPPSVPTRPPTKKKTPKRIPWDNPQDKKRRMDYNIFNLENTEIPIVRGFEALTGIEVPTYELPANKQTFYQYGNTLTTRKPGTPNKKKTANVKGNKKRDKNTLKGDDLFNLNNLNLPSFGEFLSPTGAKTPTGKQSAKKQKPATKKKLFNPFDIPIDFKF